MVFRIYKVIDESGKVVKIGSTIQTLQKRKRQEPYNKPTYKSFKLICFREFECDDREFGIILLRVREQFEISRAHLWADEGGWNITEPIPVLLRGVEGSITGKIGGKIAGHMAVKSGRILEMSKAGTAALAKTGFAVLRAAGEKQQQGRKNRENGSIQKLGHIYGHTTGKANMLKYVRSPENIARVKNMLKEPGHQFKASSASGRSQRRNKTGIFALDADHSAGIANLAAAREKQKELGFPVLAKCRTIEHQRRAGCIANHRWHIKSGRINPNCPRCCPQEKSA